MTNAKRGRGSCLGVYWSTVAALGLTLAGCGGGSAGIGSQASSAGNPPVVSSNPPVVSSNPPVVSSNPPVASSNPPVASSNPPVASSNPPVVSSNPPSTSIGAVTLNWTPPTENTNGAPLTDLTGYDIHYGTAPEDYTHTVSISNPGIATYVVDNLPSGIYYFSVTAVNSAGTESQLSPEIAATVN